MHIIAHRGASAAAKENTLSAFRLALEHKADGIEFDVHFTSSGAWVVHDFNLARTHNLNRSLLELSATEIASLGIPTLRAVLEDINHAVPVNVEIKSWSNAKDTVQYLNTLFKDGLLDKQSVLSSFDHHVIQTCQTHFDCQFGALSAHKPIDYGRYAEDLQVHICAIDNDMCDTHFVKDIHARGLLCWVYTIDEPARIRQLYEMQVDGIFTNNPLQTRAVLQQYIGN